MDRVRAMISRYVAGYLTIGCAIAWALCDIRTQTEQAVAKDSPNVSEKTIRIGVFLVSVIMWPVSIPTIVVLFARMFLPKRRRKPVMHSQPIAAFLELARQDSVYCRIKDSTLETLYNYVHSGYEPGSFVRAVLENNLSEAIGRADPDNLRALQAIVTFVYMEVPSNAWKSPEAVELWLEKHKI